MKILYDAPFYSKPKAGIARYLHEISKIASDQNNVWFSRRTSLSSHHQNHVHLPSFPHFRPHRLSFFLEKLSFKFQSTQQKFDIVHAGEFAFTPAGLLALSKGAAKIITIHDLIHEKFGAPGSLYVPEKRRSFYQSADGLIFVSKSTRSDFFSHYDLCAESTPHAVVHHGMTFQARRPIQAEKSNQFLYVGSRSGYKNFPQALEAFQMHCVKNPDARLLVAGTAPTSEDLRLSKPIEKQVDWLENPDDEQLLEAYRKCIALLYVSKYEGFGLPLLEAMSQGCIPIAGNHSSIPEVMGEGGFLINDVSSSREIAKAMNYLAKNETLRNQYVSAGFERCSTFSWQRATKETLSLYKNALTNKTRIRKSK
ncbi:MAG: glycosyltransferase family 1 protein [Verrucomicrobiota bacterium]|nr:glycosyltransferase family 1 protein [Verrucomicrobiota bacterium]